MLNVRLIVAYQSARNRHAYIKDESSSFQRQIISTFQQNLKPHFHHSISDHFFPSRVSALLSSSNTYFHFSSISRLLQLEVELKLRLQCNTKHEVEGSNGEGSERLFGSLNDDFIISLVHRKSLHIQNENGY